MVWANDAFANATLISGASGSITPVHYDGVTDPATSEAGEAVYGAGQTLWWKWVAPSSGTFEFNTAGSPSDDSDPYGLDTKLQILTSISAVVASNDDGYGDSVNSRVQFTATAGTTYYVQVDQYGTGQAGTIHLSWQYIPPAPTASTWTTSGTYNPYFAFPGDDVTVTGTHLDAVTAVTVGGVSQAFTATTSTSLVVHIDGTAVSGPVIVSNISGSAHPTHLGSDLTVYYPGPWIQPPDEPGTRDASLLNGYSSPSAGVISDTQPDFVGSTDPGSYFSALEVSSKTGYPSPSWTWGGFLAFMVLVPPNHYDMPEYDPTADPSWPPPGALDYQTENVPSVVTSDLTLTYEIDVQGTEYLESTNHRNLSEDLWQEQVSFRRLPDSDWDTSGSVTGGAWPSQAYLAGLTVDHEGSFVDPGETLNLYSTHSPYGYDWIDNGANLNNSVPPAYVGAQDVPVADLGAGRAWAITFTSFTGASSIAAPYIDPGETGSLGNGTQHKELLCYGRIRSSFTYRPPRYRLIYNTPPAPATTGWQVGSIAMT